MLIITVINNISNMRLRISCLIYLLFVSLSVASTVGRSLRSLNKHRVLFCLSASPKGGRGDGRGFPPLIIPPLNRCFHTQGAPLPWVLVGTFPRLIVAQGIWGNSNPGKNGSFFLGYGVIKRTSRHEEICG